MQETFKVTAQDDTLMLRQKQKAFASHASKMRKLLHAADQSGDGSVDLPEWRQILADPEVKTWLSSMDLATNDADTLFKLIDVSKTGTVDGEELINGVAHLKGYARSIDMHAVMLELRQLPAKLDDLAASLESGGTGAPSALSPQSGSRKRVSLRDGALSPRSGASSGQVGGRPFTPSKQQSGNQDFVI